MTEREDLGPRAGLADERVVGRGLAIVAQPQDLAVDVAEVLRGLIERRAGRHVEQAVRSEREPRAAVAVLPLGREELLHAGELLALELAAAERDRGFMAARRARVFDLRAGLVVREVDPVVLGELRVQGDLGDTRTAERAGLGHARDRLRVERRGALAARSAERADPTERSISASHAFPSPSAIDSRP